MAEHLAEELERRAVVVVRSVGCDHGGEDMDIGGGDVVEDEAGVGEIEESFGGEADEFEGAELGLGVAESDGQSLELL